MATERRGVVPLEHHRNKVSADLWALFEEVNQVTCGLSKGVGRKVTATAISYYLHDRCFLYLEFRRDWLRVSLFAGFAGARDLPGVDEHIMKGTAKVGIIRFRDKSQMERVRSTISEAYKRVSEVT